MCGITGWVDFSTEVSGNPKMLEAMTRSLSHRGPDTQGVWSDRHVSLGHRRLAIIDLEHGTQPMILESGGRQKFVVSFCGEIYNFRELRAELQSLGYAFHTSSDTEVLLVGYAHWKEALAERLNGMYAIAIWDCAQEQLVLIRDRLGVKPLYYYSHDRGIVFSSEMKALFQHDQIRPRVSRAGLCEILDMIKSPEMTAYDGIHEVRPGSTVVVDRMGLRKELYWTLRASPHREDLQNTISTIREILADTVRRQIVSDVPICTLLSGGLDSSAITALAAREMAEGRLCSFSMDFHRNVTAFSADGVRGTPDAPFARALAEHVGTRHEELLLSSSQMLDDDVRRMVLRAVDTPPAYWGDMWPSLYLLFRGVVQQSKVALSGEGADEVFGGYKWFWNPAAIAANTFPWLTAGSSRYFGGTQLLSRDFLASLDRDEYRAARYEEALREVPVLEGESAEDRRMREVSYLAITRFLPTLLDRNDRMSMAVGLEVRVPFCDHRLVEYVFNVPWQMKSFDDREKGLLREAVRSLLPATITDRVKTPYPATQDGAYEHGLRTELASLLEDSHAPVHDLLDLEKARSLLDRAPSELSQPYNRGSLEMALWLNRWLTTYDVEIAL